MNGNDSFGTAVMANDTLSLIMRFTNNYIIDLIMLRYAIAK